VHDPVVVFEIFSPATSYTDRIEKNREYRATPSVQRYVILEQTRAAATVYARAGGEWLADVLVADAQLEMPEAGISVPLSEIYEGVEFPPDTRSSESA
jgi:Uma2 family endonuclease